MKASETFETVSEIIMPDFSAFDISDFLLSIYGGTLPSNTSVVAELAKLFGISALLEDLPEVKPTTDIGLVFGQICSEIEQEFFQPVAASVVESPAPATAKASSRYIRKRLPDNAQLLQLPRSATSNDSLTALSTTSIQSCPRAVVKTTPKRSIVTSTGTLAAESSFLAAVTTVGRLQCEAPRIFVTDEVWQGQVRPIAFNLNLSGFDYQL